MDTNQHTEEKQHKQAIRAWTMYDWANSAFATTVMGVVLPTYFASYIAQGASVPIWGNAVAIGSLLAALLSPILGAIADFKASKKTFMAFFAALGIISTALLWFVVSPADQTLCIILYILGTIGFAGSLGVRLSDITSVVFNYREGNSLFTYVFIADVSTNTPPNGRTHRGCVTTKTAIVDGGVRIMTIAKDM